MATRIKYGLEWDEAFADWQIELKMYQFPHMYPTGHKVRQWEHFVRAAQILFGKNNKIRNFQWHPWAVDMVINAVKYKEVGLCGPSSCGKSEFMAIWAVLNWACDPKHTLIYVTSTSIGSAKQKVWAAVTEYYNALPPEVKAMGKLTEQPTPVIWTVVGGKKINAAGIHLKSFAQSQAKDSATSVTGSKPNQSPEAESREDPGHGRMIVILDELSDLSQAILPALTNLASAIHYSAIAASNPRNKLDPFSKFIEPEGGWDTINVNTESWRTLRGGICLHFDDLKNPNLEDFYKWLRDKEQGKAVDIYKKKWKIKGGDLIHEAIESQVSDSPEFWRNYRGWWAPSGCESTIFTDDDITATKAETKFANWLMSRNRIRVMGVDSAFSSGGDRTMAVIGDLGYCRDRRCMVVNIVAIEEIEISAADKTRLNAEQVGYGIIELCKKYGVMYKNIGFDATNIPAADALAMVLKSQAFHRVSFGQSPTNLQLSVMDTTTAKEKYTDRMTELWFFGKELLMHRQLYGITEELSLELVIRKYKTGRGGKIAAEPKREMKLRTGGRSPDMADALFIMLDVLRQRYGLLCDQSAFKVEEEEEDDSSSSWLDKCKSASAARTKFRL